MLINDNRGKQRNLKMDDLLAGDVYINTRLQKYLLCCDDTSVVFVDVDDGSVYRTEDVKDYDEYIPVKARMEIE
jgi:hypothetical protein